MITKQDIILKAKDLGFADAGFTGMEPFTSQLDYLKNPDAHYEWTLKFDLTLEQGINPHNVMIDGRGIIVVLYSYLQNNIPLQLISNFGRCYINDDRVIKDDLTLRLRKFRDFLSDNGINAKMSKILPDKLAAARAGIGTFGKNALLFASREVSGSSFIFPIAFVVDKEFEPDVPSVKIGCPDWCRNACIAACPTRALLGNGKINSQRCISYMTYHGEELTPYDLREQMGLYIYGCDRCQNVCPRNIPRLSEVLPDSQRIIDMVDVFSPEKLLSMDEDYFEKYIKPRMFYMSSKYLWKWKMNSARAMGNSLDRKYVSDLKRALSEEDDERVRSMAAWSLGRLGGSEALEALKSAMEDSSQVVRGEVKLALENAHGDIKKS